MDANGSLNHVYRTVWNHALGAMVAVAEVSGSRRKARGARTGRANAAASPPWGDFALSALGLAIVCLALPVVALANPTGAVAVHGQATLTSNGNNLRVTTQNGAGNNHSVINWQGFSIPAGSSTYFQQPNASSTSINRVVSSNPSLIFGSLGSNGHLVLVNQSGITVGAGAVVDTAGFTAAAMRMSDADALAGRMRFGDAATAAGALSVQGSVLARSGDVVLLGSRVDTGVSALVQAPNGSTILGAGQQVEITGRGLEGIVMQVQAPADSAINLGTLHGDAVGVFAGTLKHAGHIQATQVSVEGGKIVLKASGDALVQGNSQTQATSTNAQGGVIHILGDRVGLTDNAVVDASGATGGGTVLVGGDYQGKNAAVHNANFSYVGPQTTLKADATVRGNGGKVIVWADDTTRVHGILSAQGGAQGGNGGLVETSGHQFLDVAGARVNTLAAQGQTGNWLLDPTDITIVQGTTSQVNPIDATGLFSPAVSGTATLTDGDINAQMYSTNITVQTASAATDAGDIVFDSTAGAISIQSNTTATGSRSLTLNADRNIVFRGANGTTFEGTSLPLTVQLTPLATGKVVTEAGAKVTVDGTNTNTVLQLAAGKTWEHAGTLNLEGNATVALGAASTFHNQAGAVSNLGSSFKAFGPATAPAVGDGIVRNDGTMNVKNYTTIDAEYNQTGVLNIEGFSLSLNNAKSVSGVIDLAPTGVAQAGTLSVVGNQGSAAQFHDLEIRKTADVRSEALVKLIANGAAAVASFSKVLAPKVVLAININADTSETATASITNGASSFFNVDVDGNLGILALNNGTLGLTRGDVVLSGSNVTFAGDAGLYATGNLTLQRAITTSGSLRLMSGWNGDLTSPLATNSQAQTASLSVTEALTAANITLDARDAVSQTAALSTAGRLSVTAGSGIDLSSTSNNVRALLASNTGSGNLRFVNKGALDVQGVTVANGNIDIDNTGAFNNSGSLVARSGTVVVRTHSPLSINSSVVAGGKITLAALTPDGTSNITINSPMTSSAGGISIQAYNNFIQNSRLSAALGIDVSTIAGSLQFGPSAFSVGNPIHYAVNGVTYFPPWVAASLSGGATDYVASFLGQFEAALEAQNASSEDPLGLALRTREGVTVEGEICKP